MHIAARKVAVAMIVAGLSGCGGSSGGDPIPDPDDDDPAGDPVSATIGPTGGTLTTDDGGFTLTVPAGAVTQPTQFTVQPVVPSSPHAVGLAYHVAPVQGTLAQPFEIALSVPEEQLLGAHPSTFGIARRLEGGEWRGLFGTAAELEGPPASAVRLSSRSGRVVSRRPFSDGGTFVLMAFWRIIPLEFQALDPGGSMQFTVQACLDEHYEGPAALADARNAEAARARAFDDDELPELPPSLQCNPTIREATWSVQNVRGGNASFGFVAAGTPTSTAEYLAPNRPPTPNPVELSVSLFWRERGLTAPPLKTLVGIRSGILSGTASGTVTAAAHVGALYAFTANVTWTPDRTQSIPQLGIEVYKATGRVFVTPVHRCLSQLRPDTLVISSGELTIYRNEGTWKGNGDAMPASLISYYDTCAEMESILPVANLPFLMDQNETGEPQPLPVSGRLRLPENSGLQYEGNFNYEPE